MSGPDEQTVERVAKAMWAVDNPDVEMSLEGAVNFERMARAAIAAMPDTTAKSRNDELREAASRANRIAYLLTLTPQP